MEVQTAQQATQVFTQLLDLLGVELADDAFELVQIKSPIETNGGEHVEGCAAIPAAHGLVVQALESADDPFTAQIRHVLTVHGAYHADDVVPVHTGPRQIKSGATKGEGVEQADQLVTVDVLELVRAHCADQPTHMSHSHGRVEVDVLEHVEGRAGIPNLEVIGVLSADGSHDLVPAQGSK